MLAITIDEALSRLESDLRAPGELAPHWVERFGLGPDERLVTRVGAPDPRALEAADRSLVRARGTGLPRALRALLERFDGVEIGPGPAGEGQVRWPLVVPASELDEPALWPAAPADDPLAVVASERAPGGLPLVVGEISGSGHFVLALSRSPAPGEDPAVYWAAQDSIDPARRIADNLAAFLWAWCDAALILPFVIQIAGVPGWQWSRR